MRPAACTTASAPRTRRATARSSSSVPIDRVDRDVRELGVGRDAPRQDAHLPAGAAEPADDVAADETRRAGDRDRAGHRPLSGRRRPGPARGNRGRVWSGTGGP